jgi:hypothetical protein
MRPVIIVRSDHFKVKHSRIRVVVALSDSRLWLTRSINGCSPSMRCQFFMDIRPGVGGEGADCEVRRQERTAVALPEEIIVFDAGGPIRGETVLKAHADHSAPTGPLCLPEADAGEGIEDVEAPACDGSAALVSLLPNAG